MYETAGEPALVALTDDEEIAEALAAAAADGADLPIEVRALEPATSRTPLEWVPEIIFLAGQLAIGAGGNGVWVAVASLWQRVRRRRALSATPPRSTRVTVVCPVPGGEARIESVVIGDHDQAAALASIERIVRAAVEGGGVKE